MKLCDLHPDQIAEDVCKAQIFQLRSELDHLRPWSETVFTTDHGKQQTIEGFGAGFFCQWPNDSLLAELTETTLLARKARQFTVFASGRNWRASGRYAIGPVLEWPISGRDCDVFCMFLHRISPWCDDEGRARLSLLATAIHARRQLNDGQHLAAGEVAALGSVQPDRVNTLARQKRLTRIAHGKYENESVRRWLASPRRNS